MLTYVGTILSQTITTRVIFLLKFITAFTGYVCDGKPCDKLILGKLSRIRRNILICILGIDRTIKYYVCDTRFFEEQNIPTKWGG